MDNDNFKVGLALGSGGVRGIAHLGVLEVFERENLKIDIIAGTSIGSLIGGIYACGIPLKYTKGLARELNWDHITDVTFPRKGIIKGKKLLEFLKILTQNKNFSDLDLPFAALCCDIEKGEQVAITQGSVARAIRASVSIPGIYVPYHYKDRLLVDGAVLERIPVSTLRSMGADVVIAVDVGNKSVNSEVGNIFDVLINTFDIMQNKYETLREVDSDVIIKPDLNKISTFGLEQASYCITAGIKAAETSLEEIKSLLRERRK